MTVPTPSHWRLVLVVVVVAVIAAGTLVMRAGGKDEASAPPRPADLVAYEGLGAWVDVFDFAPAYQEYGSVPPVGVADVDAMADRGVATLFLQAARFDDATPAGLLDPTLLGPFLEHAHQRGMRVVAWFLPKFEDVDGDLERVRLIHEFTWNGQRFDGIALDIEHTDGVVDASERSDRLVELSRRVRDLIGPDVALGAIVLPAVLLEVVNEEYWPDFPWRELAPHFDVWLPMAYWSERRDDSGYNNGYTYVTESTERMRDALDQPAAPVHAIGGIADGIDETEVGDFLRALTDTGAIGGSLYDYATTRDTAWPVLSAGLPSTP